MLDSGLLANSTVDVNTNICSRCCPFSYMMFISFCACSMARTLRRMSYKNRRIIDNSQLTEFVSNLVGFGRFHFSL